MVSSMKRSAKKFNFKITKRISIITSISILVVLLGITVWYFYYHKPYTRFQYALNIVEKDIDKHRDNYNQMDLVNIFNKDNLEINSDIKVNASNLVGELKGLDDILNSLAYRSNTRINKPSNYLSFKLKMSHESIEKMNLNYLQSNNSSYIKSSSLGDDYIELDRSSSIDFLLDLIQISSSFKDFKNKLIKTKRLKTINTTITINNKEFECQKIIYDLSDNVITEISAFIDRKNNTPVRLEFLSEDGSRFSYNVIDNYSEIVTLKDEDRQSISLMGSLSYKFLLTVEEKDYTLVISCSPNSGHTEGTITKLNKEGIKLFDCNFTYSLENAMSSLSSLSVNLNFKLYEQDEVGTLDLNISSLLNSDLTIDEITPKDIVSIHEFEEKNSKDLKTYIIDYVKQISLKNPPIKNLPSSFR